MSQTLQDVVSLVDQTLISAAKTNYDAKVAQATTAQQQVTAAVQAYNAAQVALADAVQGKGTLSPLDAAHAVEDTDRAQRVAKMVRDAATQAVTDAALAQKVAEGKAWRGVYLAGARQRLAAARAGDAALLALAAAEKDYVEATRMLDAAANHGTLGVEAATQGAPRLMTEKEESTLWNSHGFDPVAGTYPAQWN